MIFDPHVTLGNFFEIIAIILGFAGSVVTFLVKQERMHGDNKVRFAVIETKMTEMGTDLEQMKCDIREMRNHDERDDLGKELRR